MFKVFVLDQRKSVKMQWIQCPSQNNVDIRHFANKKKTYLRAKIEEPVDHICQDVNDRTRILLSDITDYLGHTETKVNDTKQKLLQGRKYCTWG